MGVFRDPVFPLLFHVTFDCQVSTSGSAVLFYDGVRGFKRFKVMFSFTRVLFVLFDTCIVIFGRIALPQTNRKNGVTNYV